MTASLRHLARLCALLLPAFRLWSGPPVPAPALEPVPLGHVTVDDAFWAPKLQVCREATIPHSWQYLQGELRALRKAGGQPVEGELNGTWGEANLHKFLETVACALQIRRDPALERQMDEVIALLRAAQQPDGYLHAYVTNNRKVPWDPAFLDGSHDGYVLGHLIEAAIAHHAATGSDAFLGIARRAADQAWTHFLGPDGRPGFCGHAELEMALVGLYRVTREPRYLDLARAFIEWRGRGKVPPFSDTPRAYFQDGAPLRDQRTLEGHAVRAVFFASGVAGLAMATGETDYHVAAHRFWDSTTLRRMTVTGSVGPRREHEAFGEDYELPLDGYYESCAACGLAGLAHRMFLLEGRAESVDVLERVLYNAVLHGIALDGIHTYYCNPLSDRDHRRDNCWVCCPPNLSRTLLQVGRYAFAHTDRDLYVNLFVGGAVRVPLAGGDTTLRVETGYPWDGRVKITVDREIPGGFALHVRRPGWCAAATLALNGQRLDTAADDAGFWTLDRLWKGGDVLELVLDLPVVRLTGYPNIAACRGRVALQRGPLVYGFEGLDNDGQPGVRLGPDPGFAVAHHADLLGGVTVIEGRAADGRRWRAVPFYALANRGPSSQEVWVEQQDGEPPAGWWLGNLYRPMSR